MTVYKDPESLEEKLCVIASLPGGVSDVEFSLIGSGPGSNTAKITYSWPPIVYDIPGIFNKDIDAKLIRGEWSKTGQFSFSSHISQYNHPILFFFTFLCISHLKVPPIFFI